MLIFKISMHGWVLGWIQSWIQTVSLRTKKWCRKKLWEAFAAFKQSMTPCVPKLIYTTDIGTGLGLIATQKLHLKANIIKHQSSKQGSCAVDLPAPLWGCNVGSGVSARPLTVAISRLFITYERPCGQLRSVRSIFARRARNNNNQPEPWWSRFLPCTARSAIGNGPVFYSPPPTPYLAGSDKRFYIRTVVCLFRIVVVEWMNHGAWTLDNLHFKLLYLKRWKRIRLENYLTYACWVRDEWCQKWSFFFFLQSPIGHLGTKAKHASIRFGGRYLST